MAALWHKGKSQIGYPVTAIGTWDSNDRNALRYLTEASNTVKYQTMEPVYMRTKDK